MEHSKAIVAPDVFTQITNLKYFQYIFNRKETWDHFGFTDEEFERNKSCFCDIKTLSDFDQSKTAMLDYITQNGGPSKFVVKPQREGGANNFFGEDIPDLINSLSEEELSSYILMARIFPK